MRVTDRSLFSRSTGDIAAARERADRAQHLASGGLRVEHPSDDPAAAGLLAGEALSKARYDAIGAAAGRAADELQAVDGALGTVATTIARARELAVQFSNDTYDGAQRAGGAAEVDGLVQQVVSALNVEVNGRFLLAGTADGAPPFATDGTYRGNDGVRMLEVAPGVLQAASVRGDVAMGKAGSGVDVLATLRSLQAALAGNDGRAISATLGDLARSTDQVSRARVDAGVAMNGFDTAVSASKSASTDSGLRTAKLSEADFVESATSLAAAQQALEASYAATTKGFQLSLLNYLK